MLEFSCFLEDTVTLCSDVVVRYNQVSLIEAFRTNWTFPPQFVVLPVASEAEPVPASTHQSVTSLVIDEQITAPLEC